jgi:anti-sigma factor RsiW
MDCVKARGVIECYADGELDPLTSASVEKHLEHCAICRSALERLNSLSALIKEAAPYQRAPGHLAKAINARIPRPNVAQDRPVSAWWRWWQPVALVAVTAVVTWIAASQLTPPPAKQLVAAEIISSHARAKLTGRVADVASSERHTVKPWLSSKLDFSPPVVDLANAGFPLVGGRVDYLDQRPVAVVVYRRRQHVIDLFIWPQTNAPPTPIAQIASERGYQMMRWTDGGMTFWAISDLNAPELKTFGEMFSSAK